MRKPAYIAACLCLCLGVSAIAQTQFGVITGRVSDTNGALISRAKVTLTNTATNVKQETETNPEVYTFSPTSAPAITRSRSRIKASANPFGRSRSKWPNASSWTS